MGTIQAPNKIRQTTTAERFDDLTDKNAGPRLTRVVSRILEEMNKLRIVDPPPRPESLEATVTATGVLLTWADVSISLRKSMHGVEIWRALTSTDPDPHFFLNSAKRVLVANIMATAYFDTNGSSGEEFLYWIRWTDLDGNTSEPTDAVMASMP